MTVTTVDRGPAPPIPAGKVDGPASTRTVVAYGFWIFLLSDIIMFSGLFAAYAVLWQHTAGGPDGRQLFNLRQRLYRDGLSAAVELYLRARRTLRRAPSIGRFFVLEAITFVLGAAFLFIEISEFAGMVAKGAGPSRSAFLSAFFTLVGIHGAHVTSGLLWLVYLVVQVAAKGCGRICCAGCCASACSGTRSTSSGSASSLWST